MDVVTISTVVVATATVLLAIITFFYLRETYIMRKNSEKARIKSIRPALNVFRKGGTADKIVIENIGVGSAMRGKITFYDPTSPHEHLRNPYIYTFIRLFYNPLKSWRYEHDLQSSVVEKLTNGILTVSIECEDIEGNLYYGEWQCGQAEQIKGDSHFWNW